MMQKIDRVMREVKRGLWFLGAGIVLALVIPYLIALAQ